MNNKILLAYLILCTALLFSAFRGPDAKGNEATATLLCSKPIADQKMLEPKATNVIFQSKDGGQTWEDISYGLPENKGPKDFFAGESDIYVRVKKEIYRSKNNLKIPVWVKDNDLDPRCTSIAFNRSGFVAFNADGQIFHKDLSFETWMPMYTNLKKRSVRTIFESSDGAVFLGCDNGLYKSADNGRTWKQVHNEGWVMDLVESEGVLIGRGEGGIMRSTDNGEHWEWVLSDGGAGIAVERINGGFAAICYSSSTMSRRIYTSMDSGKTWKAIDEGLRSSLSISSIKQIGQYLICGHPDGIFRSSDMGKTWNIVYHTYDNTFKLSGFYPGDGKVFQLYVSGNVVYAVMRDSGC
jgi:photosystem II stability/assembly factor-like uncharacterized protein